MWWLNKDSLQGNDAQGKHKQRQKSNFLLRRIHKPDTNPLRSDLTSRNSSKARQKQPERFPVPLSWLNRLSPEPPKKNSSLADTKIASENGSEEEVLSIQDKRRILKEQEGYVAKKRLRWKEVLQNLDDLSAHCSSRASPDWIRKVVSTTRKSAGGDRGNIARSSPIGMRLKKKSAALRLWHEDVANSGGRPVTGILLHSSLCPGSDVDHLNYGLEVCKPISSFVRVDAPAECRAPERINSREQQAVFGGHGAAKNQIADYTVLVESFRRDQKAGKMKDEARALLCLGILHDNAQEFTNAIKCYHRFLDLSNQMGDARGEAMGYNFIGCSLQEAEDIKLENANKIRGTESKIHDLSTSTIIQYDKALEFHKKHAEIADLEQKFVAFTNIGLLYATLSRWTDAARCHKKALKCATYLERPQDQGVAVGNLGFILYVRRKFGASNLCIKRYLHICEALHDMHGQARAHYLLGNIAIQRDKFLEAMKEFMASFRAAKHVGDRELQTMAKVLIGFAKGQHTYTTKKNAF